MSRDDLTDLEREFAALYVGPARFNASAAGRRLGMKPQAASKMRNRASVAAEVERLCQQMADRWLVSSQRYLAEVLSLALSDVTDVLPEEGPITNEHLRSLPPQVRAAIREVQVSADGDVKVRMHDKNSPLRMLGEYIGLLRRQGLTPAGDPPPDVEEEEGLLLGLHIVGPEQPREDSTDG